MRTRALAFVILTAVAAWALAPRAHAQSESAPAPTSAVFDAWLGNARRVQTRLDRLLAMQAALQTRYEEYRRMDPVRRIRESAPYAARELQVVDAIAKESQLRETAATVERERRSFVTFADGMRRWSAERGITAANFPRASLSAQDRRWMAELLTPGPIDAVELMRIRASSQEVSPQLSALLEIPESQVGQLAAPRRTGELSSPERASVELFAGDTIDVTTTFGDAVEGVFIAEVGGQGEDRQIALRSRGRVFLVALANVSRIENLTPVARASVELRPQLRVLLATVMTGATSNNQAMGDQSKLRSGAPGDAPVRMRLQNTIAGPARSLQNSAIGAAAAAVAF